MARGHLRLYLGAAPGVGKTFAMLNEGNRARIRGTDVVVGYVETHGRPRTAEQIADLEVVPRRRLEYRDAEFDEMDVDAVLARRPERALVDELAHTNVPGSRNEKRWQDVEALLAAGIDVISTLNIQHLESVNDVVERITGVRQQETIPDAVVRSADQIELVDITPEALRRRMAHGNIYDANKIDASLANYFREGNLSALRELALLWVADRVDDALEEYRERHGISEPWETRERIVVALTGAPGSDSLIRRASRIARRAHGELFGVHVVSEQGLVGPSDERLEQHRRLLVDLGGEYREIAGADVAAALVDFALAENATQIVLGASQRSQWRELIEGSVINSVVKRSGPIDVHVISHTPGDSKDEGVRPRRRRSSLPARRQAAAWAVAACALPLLTFVLSRWRADVGLETVLLLYLAVVVAVAAIGGTSPALATAIAAFVLANYYFTTPIHHLSVAEGEHLIALLVFLGVALLVSRFVDIAARRALDAAHARSEARTLAGLAASVRDDDPLPALIADVREVFGFQGVALLRRTDGIWRVEAGAGDPIPTEPSQCDLALTLNADAVLAIVGGPVAAEEQHVLNAFAARLADALERGRLRIEAGHARALAETNALRAALLQAVSHDLRTPLAAIKASATSLRASDVQWSSEETAEFIRTINEETDRLTELVANLLDMSRIQAGVLQPELGPVGLDEVVPAALKSLGSRVGSVRNEIGIDAPAVLADSALLERALANLVHNAARVSPPDEPVRIAAGVANGHVDVRVIDRGPGIPRDRRRQVFEPFQRLGDSNSSGVGLGLAVADGFLHAMGGTIDIEDTPGGGTTFVIRLRAAS